MLGSDLRLWFWSSAVGWVLGAQLVLLWFWEGSSGGGGQMSCLSQTIPPNVDPTFSAYWNKMLSTEFQKSIYSHFCGGSVISLYYRNKTTVHSQCDFTSFHSIGNGGGGGGSRFPPPNCRRPVTLVSRTEEPSEQRGRGRDNCGNPACAKDGLCTCCRV